jgi:hypothetical protein
LKGQGVQGDLLAHNPNQVQQSMQTRCCIALCLIAFATALFGAVEAAAAQPASREPIVSLTVNNVPLGEALAALSRDTGYRFHLNSQWQAHPVSVDVSNIPLEQALKRLLRNLNHSIVWETEDTIRILVYGASEGAGSPHAVSFAAPPQEEVPEEIEPFDAAEEEVEEYVEPSAQEEEENQAAELPEDAVPDEGTDRSDADAGDDLPEETPPAGD